MAFVARLADTDLNDVVTDELFIGIQFLPPLGAFMTANDPEKREMLW